MRAIEQRQDLYTEVTNRFGEVPSCDLILFSPPPAALYLFFVLTPYLF